MMESQHLLAVYFLIVIFAIVIIGRVLFLQIVEHDKWSDKASKLTEKTLIIEPNRGDFL